MLRMVLRLGGALLGLALLGLGLALGWAHLGILRETPPLPEDREILALAGVTDRPTGLTWINTARQCTSGADGSTCVAHPVFVLEWADGRLLLVDTGMEAEAAQAFGRPMEILFDEDPAEPGRSVAEALGASRDRVAGLVFTHLHNDHTQGIAGLCPDAAPPLRLFQTPGQAERGNYTVAIGLAQVEEAPCTEPVPLADDGVAPLPGLPGVAVVRVAGHTPGSQLIVAWVGAAEPRGYVLAGDVVFEKEQIDADRSKALAYRLLITPENDEQLGRTRRWLRMLETRHGLTVIPSHDHGHLERLALPRFGD